MSDICDVGREVKVPKMLVEDIKKYCLSKHKIYEDCPFGDVPICYKLNRKVFAQIYEKARYAETSCTKEEMEKMLRIR